MTRDDDEAGGTTTTFAARRPGRAGLRRRPACAGPRVRVLSGSKCCRRARARAEVVCVRCGGDASACFYRPARRACPRRRSDGGYFQAQGERGGHPNIQLYSPTPRRARNECGRSELRSGFGGSVKIYRSDIGSCPLSIIPMGQLPPR